MHDKKEKKREWPGRGDWQDTEAGPHPGVHSGGGEKEISRCVKMQSYVQDTQITHPTWTPVFILY